MASDVLVQIMVRENEFYNFSFVVYMFTVVYDVILFVSLILFFKTVQ